jgi:hypothetical protein
MDEFDTVLDGEATPEVEQPETIGQPRDETGRFATKGVETPEPEQASEPVPPAGLPKEEYKAVREEREKRQALEREIAELKTQFQSIQPKAEPAPVPTIWEDDKAALAHVRDDAVSVAVQQASLNARLDMSEMMTRQAHADFDEMKGKALEMLSANPSLAREVMADAHPWQRAYTLAKNAAKMEALGAVDVSDLEAKIREQVKAEMATQQPVIPTSLADAQSARASGVAPSGGLSLADILGR